MLAIPLAQLNPTWMIGAEVMRWVNVLCGTKVEG